MKGVVLMMKMLGIRCHGMGFSKDMGAENGWNIDNGLEYKATEQMYRGYEDI